MKGVWVGYLLALLATVSVARAGEAESDSGAQYTSVPTLRAAPQRQVALDLPISDVLIVVDGVAIKGSDPSALSPGDWEKVNKLRGQRYNSAAVRGVLQQLTDSASYAEIDATQESLVSGVRVIFRLTSRFIVENIDPFPEPFGTEVREASGLLPGQELTLRKRLVAEERAQRYLRSRGYPQATLKLRATPLAEGRHVLLRAEITPGPELRIYQRSFAVVGPNSNELEQLLYTYPAQAGEVADEIALAAADEKFTQVLQDAGWLQAQVEHRIQPDARGAELVVRATVATKVSIHFERNDTFDASELQRFVQEEARQRSPELVRSKLLEFYTSRGYLDVRVLFSEVVAKDKSETDWRFTVIEGDRVQVVSRVYPCLSGTRSPEELDAEVDAVLGEKVPGGFEFFTPPGPGEFGDMPDRKPRQPVRLTPWTTYTLKAYQAASTHIRELYRSEGFLSASVGPAKLLRRACDPRSMPGACNPIGGYAGVVPRCNLGEQDAQTGPDSTCTPDPSKGRRCESNVVVSIPVRLGPRALLWDVEFDGNLSSTDGYLLQIAALNLGAPISQASLQQARSRILDWYQDEGYAFAEVALHLDLSEDQTRGRARFVVTERERVTVKSIVVKGAAHTSETLIRSRLEVVPGALYRRIWARKSEEQLGALGVFTSVSVSLEDPEVPAREKVVLVTVEEQKRQYVEVRPGISSAEGPRAELQYGYTNLFGQGIHFRLRSQVGYLPSALADKAQREYLDNLDDPWKRVERRNILSLEFPLAKRFKVALEGIDVRDNSRYYGITKDAAVATLTWRPVRSLTAWAAGVLEHNNLDLRDSLKMDAPFELVRLVSYPVGASNAVALRVGLAWDRTDNKVAPTRGVSASLEVEPVFAFIGINRTVFHNNTCDPPDSPRCYYRSRFLKISNRWSGYIPFNKKGLSLGLSLRWGANIQLVSGSVTYTDRLFSLGGADSLRSHFQSSVIPADFGDVSNALRAGDFVINPKAELRIPLSSLFQTAVFLDTGNLWRDIHNVDLTKLRYAVGTGLRVMTAVGPLSLDYGIKVDGEAGPKYGVFHFALGWF